MPRNGGQCKSKIDTVDYTSDTLGASKKPLRDQILMPGIRASFRSIPAVILICKVHGM